MTFSLKRFIATLLINTGLLFAANAVMAQDFPAETLRKLDSLDRIINSKNSHDTVKAVAMLNVADTYVLTDMDTTLAICEKVKVICEKTGYKKALSACYNLVGYVWQEKGNYDSALVYFLKTTKIDRELGDIKGAGTDLHNIASMYNLRGDAIRALKYYYEALTLREKINDKKGILTSTYNIATLLYSQDQEEKARAYYFRCLKIARELKDDEFISKSITSIATLYRNELIALYERNGNVDSIISYRSKVLLYYNSALQHDKQSNFTRLYASDLNALGITYLKLFTYLKNHNYSPDSIKSTFDIAIHYFEQSFSISEKSNYRQLQSYNLQYMAYLYKGVNDIARAEKLALRSFGIAEEIRSPINTMQTSLTLYEIYQEKGDYKRALHMYERHVRLKDSLANQKTMNEGLKKQYEYEAERKVQENMLLVQKTEIQELEISRKEYFIYGMASIIVLVLVLSFLFIRQSRIINDQKTMKLEQRLLRSQMNPHFIFNSLIAIQSFIYKNEPKESGKYLASFAKLVRAILENSREEYITLSKEVQWLENYLNLQQLRFDNKFDYVVQVGEDLEMENTMIPPMLTQPAIENALEHGLKNIDYKGFIEVEFKKENNYLVVRVKDNGVGISVSSVAMNAGGEAEKHASLSTVITKERLQLLNKRKFRKINFNISPVEPKGTLITFSIPL